MKRKYFTLGQGLKEMDVQGGFQSLPGKGPEQLYEGGNWPSYGERVGLETS